MTDNQQTSKYWPVIKTVAKSVKIPGTELTLGGLTELQDDLSADEAQQNAKSAMDAFLANFNELLATVQRLDNNITGGQLEGAALELAENAYLNATARKYLYSDFKGIEQMEKLVPLELDDVFVNVRMRREGSNRDRGENEDELFARLASEER